MPISRLTKNMAYRCLSQPCPTTASFFNRVWAPMAFFSNKICCSLVVGTVVMAFTHCTEDSVTGRIVSVLASAYILANICFSFDF